MVLTVEELLASLLKRRTFGLQVFFFDVTLALLGREDLKTAPHALFYISNIILMVPDL